MRLRIVALALVLVTAGCGSSHRNGSGDARPAGGTLAALFDLRGERVALIEGTSDYAPGDQRLSFLVVTHDGRAVYRPRARVWVARKLAARPFEETIAALEPIGVAGSAPAAGDVTRIYVAHVRVPDVGSYFVLAKPEGGKAVNALGNLVVKARTDSPALGSRAYPSETPTLASGQGRVAELTTRTPPDLPLLRYSVAGSLRARVPFVLAFATPKFCTSRTCGPVVDVVLHVAREFPAIRFIHVEIYRDNEPSKGFNRWVREWRLPTEPWIFLVGRDGRIKAKFEGSVSAGELAAAVRASLAPR